MRLEIDKIYGTSSNHQLNFAISENYIGYIASGGVIVSKIDTLTKKLTNQRFFCANGSSSTLNNDEMEKDQFGYPKLTQPISINSSLTNSLNELTLSPAKKILSPAKNSPLKQSNKIQQISSIAISPDEKLLAFGESGTNPRILIFSLASDSFKSPIITINEHQFGIQCLRFSKDSKHLISFGDEHDGFVYVWKINGSGTKIVALNKNSSKLNGCFWDFENDLIFTYGSRSVKIWKFEDQKFEDSSFGNNRKEKIQVRNVILGDYLNSSFMDLIKYQDDYILLTQKDGLLKLNILTNSLSSLKKVLGGNCSAIAINGDKLFFNNNYCDIKTVSLLTYNSAPDMEPNSSKSGNIISIHPFSDNLLVYLTNKEEIKLFDIQKETSSDLIGKAQHVQGLKKTVNGLYTWNKFGEIRKFEDGQLILTTVDLENKEEKEEESMENNNIVSLDCTSNKEIIIGDSSGNLLFYEKSGELGKVLKVHELGINDLKYFQLKNSKEYLISIGRDRMVQILFRDGTSTIENWELLQTISIHKSNVTSLVIQEDLIITGSTDRTVVVHKLTDTNKVELVKTITLKFTPLSIAVSKDELILSLLDKSLHIYDTSKFELQKTHKFDLNIDNIVKCQGFIIASSANNRSLQIINPINGSCVYRTWGHSDNIRKLILTDDETGLISLSQGCVFSWFINTNEDFNSTNTQILNRKVLRKDISPSKFSTPSKLNSSMRPQLTPSERSTPSNSSSPLGNISPSIRNRTASGFPSLLSKSSSVNSLSNVIRTQNNSTTRSITKNNNLNNSFSTLRPKSFSKSVASNKENMKNEPLSSLSGIEQILNLLETVKVNKDSYTVGEIKKLKQGVKFLFDEDETLLGQYNDMLLKSLRDSSNTIEETNSPRTGSQFIL